MSLRPESFPLDGRSRGGTKQLFAVKEVVRVQVIAQTMYEIELQLLAGEVVIIRISALEMINLMQKWLPHGKA